MTERFIAGFLGLVLGAVISAVVLMPFFGGWGVLAGAVVLAAVFAGLGDRINPGEEPEDTGEAGACGTCYPRVRR